MKSWALIVVLILVIASCGTIEDSANIPESGTYISDEGRAGAISRLVISKKDKGYNITFIERNENNEIQCIIEATGKKSSYGVWVEIPAYGPRLPIIIRKIDGVITVSLKGPHNPKESFQYCLSERSPAGVYRKLD